jgi:hypothetical protein
LLWQQPPQQRPSFWDLPWGQGVFLQGRACLGWAWPTAVHEGNAALDLLESVAALCRPMVDRCALRSVNFSFGKSVIFAGNYLIIFVNFIYIIIQYTLL